MTTAGSLSCDQILNTTKTMEDGHVFMEQLKEIRSYTVARLLCDNTDRMDTIQMRAFVLPDHKINPRVPCNSGVIPRLDFTKWIDDNPRGAFRTSSSSSGSFFSTGFL